MQVFTASWIVPISERPIREGWVAIDRGRTVALGNRRGGAAGPANDPATYGKTTETDLGSVAIMPGLVNAHTHLELSWMAGVVPPQARFPDWIRAVMALGRNGPSDGRSAQSAIFDAIAACHRSGTALVGDVANTMATVEPLGQSPLHAVIFHELIGFESANASALVEQAMRRLAAQPSSPHVRLTLAAHAPYSVSPLLFHRIKAALSRDPSARSCVHLGESAEELVFLDQSSGPWRLLLEDLGAWDPTWLAPFCDPAEYLDRMGFLDDRLVCVHGVHLHGPALQRLARRGSVLVTCPRGNRFTGAGAPPIGAFYAAGLRVAVGTDSLASVPDLNLFCELAELRRLAPDIPARLLLESATLQGARALGWDSDFGGIEAGRSAALIAVQVPDGCADVEEYLVSGIQPEQIQWIG